MTRLLLPSLHLNGPLALLAGTACIALAAAFGNGAAGNAGLGGAAALRRPAQPLPELTGEPLAFWQRFALNGLLEPLLSAEDPLVWAEPTLAMPCPATGRVELDGRPLVAGQAVPDTPFSMRWRLEDCLPFGVASLGLSGVVEMRLVRRSGRIEAEVVPIGLVVVSDGRLRLVSRPFTAALALEARP